MGKLAFGRFQTLFFSFSKISFAVLPHRWVTETAERQSSRQVPFISPDMLGAGFLLPGCLPMESFKAEVLFQYIHGVTEGITRSLHPQWQQYTAYTVLCLSAIPHCLPDISFIMGYLGILVSCQIVPAVLVMATRKGLGSVPMRNLQDNISKLHSWRKGHHRTDGDLPGFWCLPLAATFRGCTGSFLRLGTASCSQFWLTHASRLQAILLAFTVPVSKHNAFQNKCN